MVTAPSVEVTLRSCDGQDSFAQRRFTLAPETLMPIGRASKSAAKPDLIMAENNAFIDSPVVSREHAVLSADHNLVTPHVCITDKASMHGTYLNNNRLEPHQATKLRNGDLLQFGVDVSRNESSYTARKYLFESTLPNNFPRGFSVPDVDSSEDEDIDVDDMDDIMMPSAPRYGSQTNPVNVDDFEDAPPVSSPEMIHFEIVEEHTESGVALERTEPALAVVETEVAVSSAPALSQAPVSSSPEPEDVGEASQGSEKPTPAPFAFEHHSSSDEDMDQSEYSSDDNAASLNESVGSQDGIDSDSDAEHSDSESNVAEVGDEEDEEEIETEPEREVELERIRRERMAAMTMPNCQPVNGTIHESPFAPRPSAPIGLPQLMDSPAGPSARRDEPYSLFNTGAQASSSTTTLREPEQAASHMNSYLHPLGMFDDSFPSHVFGSMSPVPPRPAAPRPGPWSTIPFATPYPPPVPVPVPVHLRMFPEDMQPANMFLPNSDLVPDMFDRYPGASASDGTHRDQPPQPTGPSEPSWAPRKPSNVAEIPSSPVPAASEVQTPPPAPPSEPSSPPQPRRTKVSIPEIVDSPQQPPTPTSVSGSLKRKAEVLDDDTSEAVSDTLQLDATESDDRALVGATAAATTATPAPRALTPERPIKKLRSRLQSAAKYTLGAAFAVALMSQIPDAFFEA